MNDFEPGDTMIEAFRRANPVPVGSTEGRRSQPSAHALFAHIVEQRPRRVRRRVLVIAIAIVVLALLAAAFAVSHRKQSAQPLDVACYSAASLDAPRVLVSDTGDPAELCAPFWADGRFGTGSVPDFDVCVDARGVPSVFPGESGSVCSKLGLPEESGTKGNTTGFAPDLARKLEAAGCIDARRGRQLVSQEFAAYGMKGWKITLGPDPFTNARPCTSVGLEVPARTVMLVPIPRAFYAPPLTNGP